jgi:hypothetical protein
MTKVNYLISILTLFVVNTSQAGVPYNQPLSKTSLQCLVINAYHEARGEGASGVAAVTEVVLNRSKQRNMSVCDVVYQPHQFSWVKQRPRVTDVETYNKVGIIVGKYLKSKSTLTKGATGFNSMNIYPKGDGTKKCVITVKVGNHTFYKYI